RGSQQLFFSAHHLQLPNLARGEGLPVSGPSSPSPFTNEEQSCCVMLLPAPGMLAGELSLSCLAYPCPLSCLLSSPAVAAKPPPTSGIASLGGVPPHLRDHAATGPGSLSYNEEA